MSQKQRLTTQWILILGTAWTSLFITPNYSSEPIDLPKMYALVITAFCAIGAIITARNEIIAKSYRVILILFVLFLTQLILVMKFSGAPFIQQFLGAGGRNTGALTYLSFFSILVCAMFVADFKFVKLTFYSLLLTGAATLIYGLMQVSGSDPIKWNNPHSSMIGFLGNPDFSSAFLGLVGAGGFCLLLSEKIVSNIPLKFAIVLGEVLALYLIVKSHAIQGIMIYALGFFLSLGIYIFSSQHMTKFIFVVYSIFSTFIISVGVLGALKIGPLASHLYKISVRQRGFYWRAGREMLLSHPFFGVGMDSYGDWYFEKRSANAAFHSMGTSSNAAHNVLLDIGSNGGFPLLLIYMAVIALILRSSYLILKNIELRNKYISAVIVSWIAYEAQSVVSINQIGLGVWGWLLGGVILGYEINSRSSQGLGKTSKFLRKKRLNSSNTFVILVFVGLCIGLLLVQPALQADHDYRIAIQSRDAHKVESSVLRFPEDTHRTIDAASNLARSNLKESALKLAQHVTDVNSRSYEAWYFISAISDPTSPIHKSATTKLRSLNPHDRSIGN